MTNVAIKLGSFAVGLALLFGLAFAVGHAVRPVSGDRAVPGHQAGGMDGHDESADPSQKSQTLPGLAVSEQGYTLVPERVSYASGSRQPFRFAITGPDGQAVQHYRLAHEKELHLIVVARDLGSFQHLHPTRGADGTWSATLDLSEPGPYRVFADFTPEASPSALTLGVDVFVAGHYVPAALPEPADVATVDGYQVTLSGAPVADEESVLSFRVSRDGRAVGDLEPYLGAFGHLVSLRVGDLAYLHTHPAMMAEAGQRGGPSVQFATTFPTAGSYRLFLDFKHGGSVHTAAFTVTVDRHGHPTASPTR
ncbi:hypothetical protein GCM10009841_22910 [Microlunatus panaciterrae]|uniref:Secreted protein n=1 Tax=Microlunatus panaciterrae TaxID=400768 RepID=A0ABS2RDV5_9ACTN|nr:hypothetical protein [Microlunatus panaciterrae]MBM7797173.1 hypothetical protein [Microlunatus panaciterrae]